ncbi:ATP-binding protein [Desulfopila sp. IMCC35008]|uniref:hybrid sensor histidine kinase/response regulator n=1 Tax=Desulfopila sp. IMCC35008 TaxID=2653858 RepID=UPI0013D8A06C|nr:ATP-binding protein [Desulfopila sp. IMCC35008]
MKLHYKINLTSLGILLLVSLAIVIAGGTAITKISYELNRKLMMKEINTLQADMRTAVNVLKQSGVFGVESYRLAAQRDLLNELREKYNSEEDSGTLIIVQKDNGAPLLNGPVGIDDLTFLKRLTANTSGTLSRIYQGKSRFFCYGSYDEWGWLLILYEDNEKLLEMRRTFLKSVLVIMGISLAAGTSYLIWSTNRIIRPIRQLAMTADEISHGNWDAALPSLKSSDEISHLTESFREMSVNLSSTYTNLNENLIKIKKSQEELFTEKERLAVTLRSIGDGVICTDTEGRITLLNKVAEELTGWSQEDALGQPFYKIFSIVGEVIGEHRYDYNDILVRLQTGSTNGFADQTRLLSRHQNIERVISTSGAPIFDVKGIALGAILVFRDISESVKLQEELIKAHKLESVGILAGGIAHDFNNLLTGILGNISLAKLVTNENEEVLTKLDTAEKASLRAKDLTAQLLTFSKGGEPVRKLTSLIKIIEESAMFAMAGSNCRCEQFTEENLWSVEADEGQISQVLHNLVINASQAMPGGGTIEVVSENVIVRESDGLLLEPGKYICISVKDSGSGIDRTSLAKIFDPYFTTKTGGSGLGLASAYSIVKKHNGQIQVNSEQGKGSTFSVYLPASNREAETAGHYNQCITKGSGTVLVVDDEDLVKDVTGKMLISLGYNVEFASEGETAVKMYEERLTEESRYDLVIMDLTIPGGIGGKDAIQQLKQLDPEILVVVSSGYANDPIMANYRDYGFSAVLSKPFNIEDLSRTLSELRC